MKDIYLDLAIREIGRRTQAEPNTDRKIALIGFHIFLLDLEQRRLDENVIALKADIKSIQDEIEGEAGSEDEAP